MRITVRATVTLAIIERASKAHDAATSLHKAIGLSNDWQFSYWNYNMQLTPWMRKLGYAIPSWNTVIEYETTRMTPPGVSSHFSRIVHTNDSPESLLYMTEHFPAHAELLLHAKLDAICYGCTGASFYGGRQNDERFMQAMTEKFAKPVISMAGALVAGAQRLGMSRVAVAAPYEQWLLAKLVDYLQEAGLTVTNAVGLGQQANVAHAPEEALNLARRAWTGGADGLILSCGNFRTMEMHEQIEDEISKPVLTSNQAALWNMLDLTHWRGSVSGGGQLFRTLAC